MNKTKVSITGSVVLAKDSEYPEKDLLGEPHTVLPATMMVEGSYQPYVEKMEKASFLHFSSSDLRASVNTWNGRPVAINHPDAQETCNSPETFNKQWIGYVFNARYDAPSKALKADLWINNNRGKFITSRVKTGDAIDVSIGAFGDLLPPSSSLDTSGVDYDFRMTNIVGDHLAVLPDGVGACSWKDGCGIRAMVYSKAKNKPPRSQENNRKEEVIMSDCKKVETQEEAVEVKAASVQEEPKKFDMNEWLQMAPEETRSFMVNSMRAYESSRKRNISRIVACKEVKFCEKSLDEIKDMSLLDNIATLVEASEHKEEKKEDDAKVSDFALRASSGRAEETQGYAAFKDIDWAN